jgi:hypothetical protein
VHEGGVKRSWSPAAEAKLRELYGSERLPRLAFLLKRTVKAVRSRAKVLGITTGRVQRWSAKDRKLLRKLYPDSSSSHLVEVFKRPIGKIYAQANKLGLGKSATFHANAKLSGRFDKLSRAGAEFRYPKGHVPANKGLRRPGYAPGRMASTQFKKGQKPHTYRFKIGDTRVNTDGYIDQKISEDKIGASNWRALHRAIWEEAHGPVPPGHIVIFKDGNKLNCVLENLELVTLADNLRRNSIWKKLPKELASIVMLRAKIQRQINKRDPRAKEQTHERRKAARRALRHALRAARQGKPDGHRAREGRGAGG